MAVTIKDIAREVGVSYETVSRALNRRGRVNPETATRIREVAKRLNYTPNALARGLRVKNTRTLGVVFPCIYENEFYAGIYRGLEDALLQREYSIFLSNSDFDLEREARNLQSLNSRRVDGIILGPSMGGMGTDYANAEVIQGVIDGSTPVLLVDRTIRGVQTDCVSSDHVAGGRMATAHLLGLGHTRVACIVGPRFSSTEDRHQGYVEAHRTAGVPVNPELVRWSDELLNGGGYDICESLLALGPGRRPTAIFTVNDMVAMECMRAILDAGLSIPGDVSVVGYDDLKAAAQMPVGLTTIRQNLTALGGALGELFLQRVDEDANAPAFPYIRRLPNELITRASTGPAPASA